MGPRNWDRVDELVQLLRDLGYEGVKSNALGQRTIVIDFHSPSTHPALTERSMHSSSVHLAQQASLRRLTLRFPTYNPDIGGMSAPALAEQSLRDAVDVTRWDDSAPRQWMATARVPRVGEEATIRVEIFSAVRDPHKNIHVLLARDNFPMDALVGTEQVFRTAGDITEAMLDALWDS